MMNTVIHRTFQFILCTSCVLRLVFPSLAMGEDAILEATRSTFQKIPIWVMEVSPVRQDKQIAEQVHTPSSIYPQK